MQNENRNEKHPIGTRVIILKDYRFFKRAEGKIGVIHKIDHRIIPKETFPLEFTVKKQKVRLNITDLEGDDLILNIPIIKYGRVFGKIRGDQCFWHKIETKKFSLKEIHDLQDKDSEISVISIKECSDSGDDFLGSPSGDDFLIKD